LRLDSGALRLSQRWGELNHEAVSKPRIALKDKAPADEKAQHIREYVSSPEADKHFEEACNAAIECSIGFRNRFLGNRYFFGEPAGRRFMVR
jgi:hypothetical protein